MPLRSSLVIAVIIAVAMVVHAADQSAKPQWQKIAVPKGQVIIFGNIARGGFYSLSEGGLSLKQIVIAAGMPNNPEGAVIQLRRPIGTNEAKIIEVKVNALDEDGNIDLEPNDIIQVLSAKAG